MRKCSAIEFNFLKRVMANQPVTVSVRSNYDTPLAGSTAPAVPLPFSSVSETRSMKHEGGPEWMIY